MAKDKTKLTNQQRLFADLIIEGRLNYEAYNGAYPNNNLNRQALAVQSTRMLKMPKVKAYIDEALAERRMQVLLTRDKKRQILGGIAQDPKAPKQARIAAIQVDNRMTGDEQPVRVEGEITLIGIFRALTQPTTLPSGDEVALLKQAVPVAQERTVGLPDEAPTSTAMERMG